MLYKFLKKPSKLGLFWEGVINGDKKIIMIGPCAEFASILDDCNNSWTNPSLEDAPLLWGCKCLYGCVSYERTRL